MVFGAAYGVRPVILVSFRRLAIRTNLARPLGPLLMSTPMPCGRPYASSGILLRLCLTARCLVLGPVRRVLWQASTEGWGKLSTLKEIDTLIDNLNVRGMREKVRQLQHDF